MKCLVIAEQEEGLINRPTLASIFAATKLSKEIDLLLLDPTNLDQIKKLNEMCEKLLANLVIEDYKVEID